MVLGHLKQLKVRFLRIPTSRKRQSSRRRNIPHLSIKKQQKFTSANVNSGELSSSSISISVCVCVCVFLLSQCLSQSVTHTHRFLNLMPHWFVCEKRFWQRGGRSLQWEIGAIMWVVGQFDFPDLLD